MSTTARKARKKAGIPFTPKAPKVATPLIERAFVTEPVLRRDGDALPIGFIGTATGLFGPRSPLRIARFLDSGGRPKANRKRQAVAA